MTARKPGFLRRTLGFFWRLLTWFRIGLSNLLFLLLLILIGSALMPGERYSMPDKTALRIAPSGFLVDQRSTSTPLAQLLEDSAPEEVETVIGDLIKALQQAASDDRITSLVLDLGDLEGGGISKLNEVGAALDDFHKSGKKIIAVSDTYSQEQYFLASYADQIYLNPMGNVMLTGYGSYRNYFRDALDKLKLNFHVFRVGEYKDAVEPFLENGMSTASREHNSQWLNELWDLYTQSVEARRHLSAGSIDDYVNNMSVHLAEAGGDSARLAVHAKLVDAIATHTQVDDELRQQLGSTADGDYQAIDYQDYLHLTKPAKPVTPNKIGLLVLEGTIIDGDSTPGTIGGDTVVGLIQQARADSDLKALVVRVDSGGGSAFASEQIREALDEVRADGVPVVVSMGSVAASGGYWLSMASDEVWATPATITGSIGVFSAFPTLEQSLSELGIHTDGVGTTNLAGAMRLDRPLDDNTKTILQLSVENIYQRFLNLVANARHATPEDINKVAQGHVWTGTTAHKLGLVDQLGSQQDAIAAAAVRAGIEQYELIPIREQLSPGEQILAQLTGAASAQLRSGITTHIGLPAGISQLWAPLLQTASTLQQMNDPRGLYVQCLECTAP